MNDKTIEELLRENIQASNRTTHAVRAFVLFLFVQLTFGTLAWGLWQVGLASASTKDCGILPCAPDDGWSVVVTVLVALGVWISSQLGWNELAKSRVGGVAAPTVKTPFFTSTTAPAGSAFTTSAPESTPLTHEDLEALLADYVQDANKFMNDFLTPDQIKIWAKSGAPHLGAWINLGMPRFERWLKRASSS